MERRTAGTKPDTLPRTEQSWISPDGMMVAPAGKLGEGATAVTGAELCERLFQSTPPARGATRHRYQSAALQPISIHAPREGGDRELISKRQELTISIHAPREGGDRHPLSTPSPTRHFNPRPPRGGRPICAAISLTPQTEFQSTPPARGATPRVDDVFTKRWTKFQSTPPARGATLSSPPKTPPMQFQSTPPARGATLRLCRWITIFAFQSTPPARGATEDALGYAQVNA